MYSGEKVSRKMFPSEAAGVVLAHHQLLGVILGAVLVLRGDVRHRARGRPEHFGSGLAAVVSRQNLTGWMRLREEEKVSTRLGKTHTHKGILVW